MNTLSNYSILGFGLLMLSGCATDTHNDPRTGGLIGGMRGLSSGDYEARQQHLEARRDDSLTELRALQDRGGDLEFQRQMKAEDVAFQRRQLGSLRKKNLALAKRIGQLRLAKSSTEAETLRLERQYALLTQNIDQFEQQLAGGRLSVEQAESRRLDLEQQYATLSSRL